MLLTDGGGLMILLPLFVDDILQGVMIVLTLFVDECPTDDDGGDDCVDIILG